MCVPVYVYVWCIVWSVLLHSAQTGSTSTYTHCNSFPPYRLPSVYNDSNLGVHEIILKCSWCFLPRAVFMHAGAHFSDTHCSLLTNNYKFYVIQTFKWIITFHWYHNWLHVFIFLLTTTNEDPRQLTEDLRLGLLMKTLDWVEMSAG